VSVAPKSEGGSPSCPGSFRASVRTRQMSLRDAAPTKGVDRHRPPPATRIPTIPARSARAKEARSEGDQETTPGQTGAERNHAMLQSRGDGGQATWHAGVSMQLSLCVAGVVAVLDEPAQSDTSLDASRSELATSGRHWRTPTCWRNEPVPAPHFVRRLLPHPL
jgi:hypothetical protein